MNKKSKIIFMGTPDFAVPSLKALLKQEYNVTHVVTQPDRPKGRGRKVIPPPVKQVALNAGLNVSQPLSVKNEQFIEKLKTIGADIFVVVAFGHILPRTLLEVPKIGSINVHASLLPKYRGPAPIQWAILNRDKETGVTAILLDEGLDTGKILKSARIEIASDDTAASLHDRLSALGGDLLISTLREFETGVLDPLPQDLSQATYAPKLKKSDGHIQWEKPVEALEAFVRGMTPWPGAFTYHEKKRLKIFKARPIYSKVTAPPGTVLKGFPDELRVATGKGILSILEIQGESGKRLPVEMFRRGYKIPPGTVLK